MEENLTMDENLPTKFLQPGYIFIKFSNIRILREVSRWIWKFFIKSEAQKNAKRQK